MSIAVKPTADLAAVLAKRDWGYESLGKDVAAFIQQNGGRPTSSFAEFQTPGIGLFTAVKYAKDSGDLGEASRELMARAGVGKAFNTADFRFYDVKTKMFDLPRALRAFGEKALCNADGALDVGKMIAAYQSESFAIAFVDGHRDSIFSQFMRGQLPEDKPQESVIKTPEDLAALRSLILTVSAKVAPGVHRELDKTFANAVDTILTSLLPDKTDAHWNRA